MTLISEAIPRTARKPWRCVCADPILGYEVKRVCEHGWSSSRFRGGIEDVNAHIARTRGTRCHGGKTPATEEFEVIEITNPNYRPDCPTGDIAPGDAYIEYVGDAHPYEHGSSYCLHCGEAVWTQ